eukprot:CAMPEP_0119296866 /NCGR_PEP_ID=MMETSP1329-20130426/50789_1 /TAXON_ID=114041 /ORGANISM="Genus nov. species nov., Strain RCC1024" /LENGTH=832 /DNA_ID=CAMNT_0007297807 /DNA_START=82 /DNA_END=2577 /DNA_ORIENTATION=-
MSDSDSDDIVIEDVTGMPHVPAGGAADAESSDDDIEITEIAPGAAPAESESDDDILVEEVPAPGGAEDSSDDDILITEVTNLSADPDDDSDGIEVTEAVTDDESDGIVVEEVGAPSSSSDSEEEEDEEDDDMPTRRALVLDDSEEEEDEDDDDMPTIEEVAPPERTGPAGALRSGFLHKKQKAPPSKLELVRLKEEKRIAGNEDFSRKRFRPAAALYGEAIDVDPYDATLYCNRAACYLELGDWSRAYDDAEECVKLDPNFAKGFFRLAKAARMRGLHDAALGAAKKGLDLEPASRPLREEYARAKKDARASDRARAIKEDLHDLCAEMTPEERRWKAWWGGQGHPTCVNNTNLERYIPDCPIDVSYDAEVTQELHGPDNLPRLESDDEEDEDDLLLEEILERLELDYLIPQFEDEGLGPRSFLTCARLPALRPLLSAWLGDACGVDDPRTFRRAIALAEAQARDCLDESWDAGADSLMPFPPKDKLEGLGATYPNFSWRQRVRELELRVLLPPGCTGRDLIVKILPRRIVVKVKRDGLRVWPYERNAWTSIVDVGPQLPGAAAQDAVPEDDDDEESYVDGLDMSGAMDDLDGPVGPEPAKGPGPSNAEMFRRAKGKSPAAEAAAAAFEDLPGSDAPAPDDDSDVEVEEMPPLDGSDSEPEVEEMPPLDGSDSEPEVEEMPPLDGSDSEPEVEEMPPLDGSDSDELEVEELPLEDDGSDDSGLEVEELPPESDSDEEPEVEELPLEDEPLDAAEEPEPEEDDGPDEPVDLGSRTVHRRADTAAKTPAVVSVEWVDGGLTLKAFEVTIPASRRVADLKNAIAEVAAVPEELQV